MILILFKELCPLLFEQPRAELAGPALIKMRAGGETIGGTIGGENQKEKEKVFDPKSSLSSSIASPSSGSDCGMVECSNCGLRQPLQCGGSGDYEMVDEAALKALKVSDGFDASKNVDPLQCLRMSGWLNTPMMMNMVATVVSVESGWSWAFLGRW